MGALRFHLAVDDGGEFLVVGSDVVEIGHRTAGTPDLGFLAPLAARHCRIERRSSLREGIHYLIHAYPGARVEVAGRGLVQDSARLRHGDRILLGERVRLRLRLLGAASASAQLSVESSEDCEGAREILLVALGAEGRISIGPKKKHSIAIADLEHEVALELHASELVVACAGGFGAREAVLGATALCVPLPLHSRVWIQPRARGAPKPPFALTLMPLERGA